MEVRCHIACIAGLGSAEHGSEGNWAGELSPDSPAVGSQGSTGHMHMPAPCRTLPQAAGSQLVPAL